MEDTRVGDDLLRVRIDPQSVPFETTIDAEHLDHGPTQNRALEAIEFWASVEGDGFNLFAMGPIGIGRHAAIRTALDRLGPRPQPFDDWVYVNNFQDPHHPRALQLPFGTAVPFRDAMVELIEDLAGAVPATIESDDYKARRSAIEATQQSEQEERLASIRKRAAAKGLALLRTPMGFAIVPTQKGEIVKPEVFNKWPVDERAKVEASVEEFQEELGQLFSHDLPAVERDTRAQIRELNRTAASATIELAVADVAKKFSNSQPIQQHLANVLADLKSNFHLFLILARAGDDKPLATKLDHPTLRRYAVNVMDASSPEQSSDDEKRGRPVIEETDPTHANLVGRIEHQQIEGALITDFTMIKHGALHRANGGYLILDARDVLMQPFAWEALKRCLKFSAIRIASVTERLSLVSTTSLDPDEIPLSVKVGLIGDRYLFYLLSALDPDFPALFKVQADFDDDIVRDADSITMMAGAIAGITREKNMMAFGRTAVAALLEEMSRISDDAAKFTLKIEALSDLMHEAQHYARRDSAESVARQHVISAVEARKRRTNRLRERTIEMVDREIVNIDIRGEHVGQINGLSVISLGEARFGRPTRISARTRMGTGKIIDIEREVRLGGPLHSKGVLILSSFLATRYGSASPVSLSASIVFEQSYSGVDGDSASSTELYALLSALAEAPISQALAVTGSVDQFGRVQAIGGVNEKVEGFFDICVGHGLTGVQGVLIPKANVQHLNLRQDVADAVKAGQFTIYAVDHIDTGIELLTGIQAGIQVDDGSWPADSINGRVAARLDHFAETMKSLIRYYDGPNGSRAEREQ